MIRIHLISELSSYVSSKDIVFSLADTYGLEHDVNNVVPVSAISDVDMDQVFMRTCTNGSYDDLATIAALLEGRDIASGTWMIVTPATREVYQRAERNELLETFMQAGATVTNATCDVCLGLGTGIIGKGRPVSLHRTGTLGTG